MKPEEETEAESSITNAISNDVTYISQISEMVDVPRGRYVFIAMADSLQCRIEHVVLLYNFVINRQISHFLMVPFKGQSVFYGSL
jgi:hypothetical protein